jgi:hypothetical protein
MPQPLLSDSQIVLLGRSSLAFARRYSGSETNGRQYRHDHALLPDSGRVAVGSKRRSARRPRILPERSNLYGLAVRAVVVLQIVQHLARSSMTNPWFALRKHCQRGSIQMFYSFRARRCLAYRSKTSSTRESLQVSSA